MHGMSVQFKTKTIAEIKRQMTPQKDLINNQSMLSQINEITSGEADDTDIGQQQLNGCLTDESEFSPPQDPVMDYEDNLSDTGDSDHSDDSLVIDLVMASNTDQLSSGTISNSANNTVNARNCAKISTKKPKTKASAKSRTVQSRLSMDSDSDDSIDQDSEGETITRSTPYQPASGPDQAWAAFENVVKRIDNTNPEWFLKKPKPNSVSSGTFQKVMVDMYGITDYGNTEVYSVSQTNMAYVTLMASQVLVNPVTNGTDDRDREGKGLSSKSNGADNPQGGNIQKGVRRSRCKLKMKYDKDDMEHELEETKPNEFVVQDHVEQMPDMEKTRHDLYERYGILPTILPNGKIVCENQMLSQRSRTHLYGDTKKSQFSRHESKQPSSHQLLKGNLISKTQSGNRHYGNNQLRIDNSQENPLFKEINLRPKTANRHILD